MNHDCSSKTKFFLHFYVRYFTSAQPFTASHSLHHILNFLVKMSLPLLYDLRRTQSTIEINLNCHFGYDRLSYQVWEFTFTTFRTTFPFLFNFLINNDSIVNKTDDKSIFTCVILFRVRSFFQQFCFIFLLHFLSIKLKNKTFYNLITCLWVKMFVNISIKNLKYIFRKSEIK